MDLGDYRELLAGNVRAERARNGLSQIALAARMRALGFGQWQQQTVGTVERGSRRLMADEVYGLAIALETSLSTFMLPPSDGYVTTFPARRDWALAETA